MSAGDNVVVQGIDVKVLVAGVSGGVVKVVVMWKK